MSDEGPIRTDAVSEEGWGAVSRRALLKAGWTAPVIMTVAPAVAFAASGSPAGGATPVSPTGARNARSSDGNPSGSSEGPAGASEPTGGLPAQSTQGPQPARTNRGFTG